MRDDPNRTEIWLIEMGEKQLELGPGQWTVGRGASCEIRADDFCLSRRHALLTIDGDGMRVRDAGSHHGVFHAGRRVDGEVALHPGDIVMLGATTLTVIGRARRSAPPPPARSSASFDDGLPSEVDDEEDSPPPGAVTNRFDVDGALVAALEGHMLQKDFRGARVILERVFQIFRQRESMPMGADPTVLRAACKEAMDLADHTDTLSWLDRVVEIHRVRPRVMSATTAQRLAQVLSRRAWPAPPSLRGYLGDLSARAARFDSYERTVLERLTAIAQPPGS